MASPARSQSTADAVAVRDLHFAYDEDAVLSVASFVLPLAQSCAVIGPSGCGKTTFVHLVGGLLTPQRGAVEILGQDLAKLSEPERDRFRGRHIGFVFQRFHLLPALSVRENLLLAQRLARSSPSPTSLTDLLERLGLLGVADRKPGQLSQGQAQRAAIARALVHSPDLVIADEPTSALDDKHARQVLSLLQQSAAASGAALLVVTHDQRIRGALGGEFDMGVAA